MTNLRLAAQIAKTHLLSRLKQSIIAALGVTFGIAMFIFMISFMTGVNNLLEDTMLSSTPHVRIYNDIKINRANVLDEAFPDATMKVVYHQKPADLKKNLRNGFQILTQLKKDPRVTGVSPLLNSQVFYNYGAHQINGQIAGVDILEEDKMFDLKSKLIQGRLENLFTSSNGIIMGCGLAKKMDLHMGDKVSITTPSGTLMLMNIVGIIQTGVSAIDDIKSYATLSTSQKILQKDSRYITDINIKITDLYKSKEMAREYAQISGYKAEDWETANATILVSFTLRNFITYAVVITLLTVAGFGIYNIMNMTIYEKMKDIAILKATGFSGNDVKAIFMTEALTIGIVGGIMGLLIGFGISTAVSHIPFHAEGFVNMDHLPVNFAIKYYIGGIGFGVITTAVAGWMPSRKASKIDPVEIIRG